MIRPVTHFTGTPRHRSSIKRHPRRCCELSHVAIDRKARHLHFVGVGLFCCAAHEQQCVAQGHPFAVCDLPRLANSSGNCDVELGPEARQRKHGDFVIVREREIGAKYGTGGVTEHRAKLDARGIALQARHQHLAEIRVGLCSPRASQDFRQRDPRRERLRPRAPDISLDREPVPHPLRDAEHPNVVAVLEWERRRRRAECGIAGDLNERSLFRLRPALGEGNHPFDLDALP